MAKEGSATLPVYLSSERELLNQTGQSAITNRILHVWTCNWMSETLW